MGADGSCGVWRQGRGSHYYNIDREGKTRSEDDLGTITDAPTPDDAEGSPGVAINWVRTRCISDTAVVAVRASTNSR